MAACASGCLNTVPLLPLLLEQIFDPFRGRMDVKAILMGLDNMIIRCAPDLECPTHIGVDVVCPSSRVKRARFFIACSEVAVVARLFIGNALARQWLGAWNWSRSRSRSPRTS